MIIKYWLLRTRFLRLLRIQVSSIVHKNLETECLYCQQQYGLTCELIESIEDMFFNYINETGETVLQFDFNKWMVHFRKHSSFRTVCFECYEQMELEYKQDLKRKRV